MAIDKFLDDKANNKYNEVVIEDDNADPLMVYIKSLATKLDEGLTKTNTHIDKVVSLQNEINTEKNKDGITTAQTNAIVANTAKTGITTAQSRLITALNEGVQQAVPTTTKGVTATVIPRVVVGKTNSLELSIRLSNGQIYATSLTLTRIK